MVSSNSLAFLKPQSPLFFCTDLVAVLLSYVWSDLSHTAAKAHTRRAMRTWSWFIYLDRLQRKLCAQCAPFRFQENKKTKSKNGDTLYLPPSRALLLQSPSCCKSKPKSFSLETCLQDSTREIAGSRVAAPSAGPFASSDPLRQELRSLARRSFRPTAEESPPGQQEPKGITSGTNLHEMCQTFV